MTDFHLVTLAPRFDAHVHAFFAAQHDAHVWAMFDYQHELVMRDEYEQEQAVLRAYYEPVPHPLEGGPVDEPCHGCCTCAACVPMVVSDAPDFWGDVPF